MTIESDDDGPTVLESESEDEQGPAFAFDDEVGASAPPHRRPPPTPTAHTHRPPPTARTHRRRRRRQQGTFGGNITSQARSASDGPTWDFKQAMEVGRPAAQPAV